MIQSLHFSLEHYKICVKRTQKLIKKTNKRQQTIFHSFDCFVKKKRRIDVDLDIDISDVEEHEQ